MSPPISTVITGLWDPLATASNERRHLIRARVALRGVHEQDPVHAGVGQACLDGGNEPVARRISQDVDGVRVTPVRGQRRVQKAHGLLGKVSEATAVLDERVGGHDAEPAGVGDDRDVRSGRQTLGVEHLGGVEEVGDLVHAQDAHAAEGCLVDLVVAGHRSRVRERGLGTGRVPARLEDDDRLAAREAASPRS